MKKVMALAAAAVLTLAAMPVVAQTPRQTGLALGFGIGRLVPLENLAVRDDGAEYKLDGGQVTIASVEYWWYPWLGNRIAYHWGPRGDLDESPDDSFARVSAYIGGVVLAPVEFNNRRTPYLVLAATWRHYDVNAIDDLGNEPAGPNQRRVGGYFATGGTIRIRSINIVPELGFYVNEYRNNIACVACEAKTLQKDLLLSVYLSLR